MFWLHVLHVFCLLCLESLVTPLNQHTQNLVVTNVIVTYDSLQ